MEEKPYQPTRRLFMQHSAVGTAAAVFASFFDDFAAAQSSQPSTQGSTMSKIKGTKTEKNLLKAFAGESQARNRYYFFADKAHEEGYEHIAAIFRETGDQEMVHALQFFRYLDGGGSLEITAAYPAGTILTTEKNLESAAGGEHEEWSELYPEFAKIAKEEGFTDVFRTFHAIAISEKQHEKRYLAFLEHLKAGDLFKRNSKVVWRCRKCGYVSGTPEAPGVCPACKHPQSWFEILSENW